MWTAEWLLLAQPNKVNNYGNVGLGVCSFNPRDRGMFEASQGYTLRTHLKFKKKKKKDKWIYAIVYRTQNESQMLCIQVTVLTLYFYQSDKVIT